MRKGKNQHVVKHPDGWAVRGEGNSKVIKVTRTQKGAIDGGGIRGIYPVYVFYKLKKYLLADGGLWTHCSTLFAVIGSQTWLVQKLLVITWRAKP